MSVEVKVPNMGESIEDVTIDQWLKQEGDAVELDEPIAVLESDKATVELPAPATGVLEAIAKVAGDRAAVDEVIARIAVNESGTRTEPRPARDGAGRKKPDRPEGASSKTAAASEAATADRTSEPEEAKAADKGSGTAPDQKAGTAPEPAAESGSASAPAPSVPDRESKESQPAAASAESREERVVPMSPIRRRIAERLVEAQRNAALLTTFNKIDMSRVIDIRKRHQDAFRDKYGIKLGFMSFFVKASVEALKRIPEINAEIRDEHIVYRNYYDIGIAIGSERGLVVPILRNAERLSFAAIEQQIADFARRANEKRLEVHELQGGTFTISNGGVYGSLLSTPIVNPPQSGVLGLHAIEDQPVVFDGAIEVRPVMYVALSYDHRIVDGREAVGFLKTIKEVVEDPASILLEL